MNEIEDLYDLYQPVIIEELSKRLVVINCYHTLIAEQEGVSGVARFKGDIGFNTGFLIDVGNEWFVATAGHVIRKYADLSKQEREISQLTIYTGLPQLKRIDLSPRQMVFMFHERSGVDYGLIPLTLDERKEVGQSGSLPFHKEQYDSMSFEPNLYLTTGFPHDGRHTQSIETDSAQGYTGFQQYPLIRLNPIKQDRTDGQARHFRGEQVKAPGDLVLVSTNGMSGGPIVALRLHSPRNKNREKAQLGMELFLLAIQNFERDENDKRILGGTLIRRLTNAAWHRKYRRVFGDSPPQDFSRGTQRTSAKLKAMLDSNLPLSPLQ